VWRQCFENRGEEGLGQMQVAITLVLLGFGTDADRQSFLVKVVDRRRDELWGKVFDTRTTG
jgi:hypothetical protein